MGDHIEESLATDHQSLALLLENFETALAAGEFGQAFELLDLFWARLAMHIRAENVSLFPAILEASAKRPEPARPSHEEVQDTIKGLRTDHDFLMDSLGAAIKTMRMLLTDPENKKSERVRAVRDSVATVKERLARHNLIEEQEVYRWPGLMLDSEDLTKLVLGVRLQIENLPARFRKSASDA